MALQIDPDSKKYLDGLLAKDKNDLSEEDKGFIRARIEYLSNDQKDSYKAILSPKKEDKKDEKKK